MAKTGKKMSKDEKKRRKKEAAELRVREAVDAKLLAEQEERAREEEEQQRREQQLLQDARERVLRREQLADTDHRQHKFCLQLAELEQRQLVESRWRQHLRCDGLPDLLSRAELNALLREAADTPLEQLDHQLVMERCATLLQVIRGLQAALEQGLFASQLLADDMRQIIEQCEALQQYELDVASYLLLTDMRPHTDLETSTLQFCSVGADITLALWANVGNNMKNNGFFFEELGLRFELPRSLMDKDIAVRVLRTNFDHLSKLCASQHMPTLAQQQAAERLSDVVVEEDVRVEEELLAIQEEAARLAAEQEAAAESTDAAPEASKPSRQAVKPSSTTCIQSPRGSLDGNGKSQTGDKGSPTEKQTKSSKRDGVKRSETGSPERGRRRFISRSTPTRAVTREPTPEATDSASEIKVVSLLTVTAEHELNLRQFRVIGGLIHLNLVRIPSQPVVVGLWTLRQVDDIQTVDEYSFSADYKPPAVADASAGRRREPQEIEREIRQQEAEMQKLISLSIDLPDSVLWFEPPVFVRWDEKCCCWSTDGFYETRYNEDSLQLQARTVQVALVALAVVRFSNLPLQSWTFTPTGINAAQLHITAAIAAVKLHIQGDQVSLEEVVGGSNSCMDAFYNQPMKPEQLIELLRSKGLDLFPDEDSSAYIEGSSLKHQPCEKHLYRCMSLVSAGYGFSSSRWNLLAGPENLVLQFREIVSAHQQGNSALLLVRPRKTTIIECTEASPAFSDVEAEGMPYFADLLHLVDGMGSLEAQTRVSVASIEYMDCVHTILSALRLLSYS